MTKEKTVLGKLVDENFKGLWDIIVDKDLSWFYRQIIIETAKEYANELQKKVYELESDYMELQTKLQTTDFKIRRIK